MSLPASGTAIVSGSGSRLLLTAHPFLMFTQRGLPAHHSHNGWTLASPWFTDTPILNSDGAGHDGIKEVRRPSKERSKSRGTRSIELEDDPRSQAPTGRSCRSWWTLPESGSRGSAREILRT